MMTSEKIARNEYNIPLKMLLLTIFDRRLPGISREKETAINNNMKKNIVTMYLAVVFKISKIHSSMLLSFSSLPSAPPYRCTAIKNLHFHSRIHASVDYYKTA